MAELNPNHPVTRAVSENWHKICALLISKYGGDKKCVEITQQDIQRAFETTNDCTVVADERGGTLKLYLVTRQEGERLAREEGGLPH